MGRKYTQARKEWNEKWLKENYARVSLAIPKGEKELIREASEAAGETMNGYIMKAVRARFKEEGLI